MNISKFYNRDIYSLLVEQSRITPKSPDKLIECYPFLETVEWSKIYKLPYHICSDTFIQSQQFKLLHRYTNCNANLYKWKIIESPNCGSFDTIEHFYFECDKAKSFWNNICICIKTVTDINLDFTVLEVLLGILQENIHSVLCNYIILHAKSYI